MCVHLEDILNFDNIKCNHSDNLFQTNLNIIIAGQEKLGFFMKKWQSCDQIHWLYFVYEHCKIALYMKSF